MGFLHTLLSLGHRLCARARLVSIPSSGVVHEHVPLPSWAHFPSHGHQALCGELLQSPAVIAPGSPGYRCRWHRCTPGTARVERANSQPGLLQILLIHRPGRRGDLCLWHDGMGQGELPAGEERRSEPQGSSAGCILSKSRCKCHPVQDRLRSPQHPPFPGSAQADGLCHTQKHPGGGGGHPQRSPGPAPDARRGQGSCPAAQALCGFLPRPLIRTRRGSPGHPSWARGRLGKGLREVGRMQGRQTKGELQIAGV